MLLLRSTTNWNARFGGVRVDLVALADKCRRKAVLFKSRLADDSTLPGGCFRNCVHLRVRGKEVKVFPTCCQINHSLDPPLGILAELAVFLFGGDKQDDYDKLYPAGRMLVKCALYPVLEVATMRLGFAVSEWKVCNLINFGLPDYSATFWPRAKGRGGVYVSSNHNASGTVLMVRCTAGGRAFVLGERLISRKPSSCFVYSTGTIVTSNYNRAAHQRLYTFLASHARHIAATTHNLSFGQRPKAERNFPLPNSQTVEPTGVAR